MDPSRVMSRIHPWAQPLRELSLRREVLALLLIFAETMIVYVFAGTLLAEHEAPYTPLSIIVVFAVLVIGRVVPHLLNTIRVWTPQYEIIMAVSLIATLLVVIKAGAFPEASTFSTSWLSETVDALILRENNSVRPVWMLIAFASIAWWRGKTRAEASLETAYGMLRLGVIWMAGAIAFTVLAAPEGSVIFQHMSAALIGFIAVTLLAIAIARQPEGEDAAAWNASWVWLLVFAVPVLLITAASISAVGVFTRDTLDLAMAVLGPVFWLVRVTLQALILAVAILAFIAVSPLIWFLERQGFRPMGSFPDINLSPGSRADAEELARSTLQIDNPVRYLIAGLILLALFWLLIRFSFRRRKRWTEQPRHQRESLIDWDTGSGNLLRRVQSWLGAQIHPLRKSTGPEGPEWAATRRIRQTYRQFLRMHQRRKQPRHPGETPRQFAQRLEMKDVVQTPEIQQITELYNQTRYSGAPASGEEADAMDDAWQRLRSKAVPHESH